MAVEISSTLGPCCSFHKQCTYMRLYLEGALESPNLLRNSRCLLVIHVQELWRIPVATGNQHTRVFGSGPRVMCGILFSVSPTSSVVERSGSLLSLISRRGPDSTCTHTATFEGYTLTFTSSVLSLRGTSLTPQPLIDTATGSVLCWNGEAWRIGDDALEPGVNDGQEVFRLLLAAEKIEGVLEGIAGPYALVYFDASRGMVWFGRDVLGRRSLLWKRDGDVWVVASVGDGDREAGWKEVEAEGVTWLDLKMGCGMGVVPYLWEGSGEFMRMPFQKLNTAADCAPEALDVVGFGDVLLDSVDTRVRDIPGRGEHVRTAILFSGGLDCTMIARLVHECLPQQEGVDLLNVAFENRRVIDARNGTSTTAGKREKKKKKKRQNGQAEVEELVEEVEELVVEETNGYEICPDRITGRKSLEELCRVCPGRDWRFVAINVPYSELLEHRQVVIRLIHPHNTEMDLSIAVAFYFASRGTGLLSSTMTSSPGPVLYTTPARILFSGLGADELLGGYARHSTAYRFRGAEGLLEELQLDVSRLGKRNLGRDDRVLAHWGHEARYPFLEERVVGWCMRAGWEGKRDKALLRHLAVHMGMAGVAAEPKRAVQFGSRSARMEKGEKGKVKGTKVLGE